LYPGSDLFHCGHFHKILEKDRELIASQSGDGIAGPQPALQPLSHGYQEFIAYEVPQAVIDQLKMIQIQEQDRDLGAS
jgi:hypothetical protein